VRRVLAGELWPLPALAILSAVSLAFLLPEVDTWLQEGEDNEPLGYVFGGGPSAARTVLSAIASSLISVTTLLFSLTIVTLQLASSQYSPRLLQTFVRDRVVQTCLGILLGTFVFALVVLRTVRSADESGAGAFVPRLSVTVALVFTLASIEAGRAKVGKTLEGFDVVPTVPIVIGDDPRACADPIRWYAALYVGGMGSREKNFYNQLASS
jgi:uncharacterized membrane protein